MKKLTVLVIISLFSLFVFANNGSPKTVEIHLDGLNSTEVSRVISNWDHQNENVKTKLINLNTYQLTGYDKNAVCSSNTCYEGKYIIHLEFKDNKAVLTPVEVNYTKRSIKRFIKKSVDLKEEHHKIERLLNDLAQNIANTQILN
ncbi:MAG: hypothetical protein H6604_08975 [Flavobacteriales bacterium]|nr:hypothetical protein [Flavobacteriales bacterium]